MISHPFQVFQAIKFFCYGLKEKKNTRSIWWSGNKDHDIPIILNTDPTAPPPAPCARHALYLQQSRHGNLLHSSFIGSKRLADGGCVNWRCLLLLAWYLLVPSSSVSSSRLSLFSSSLMSSISADSCLYVRRSESNSCLYSCLWELDVISGYRLKIKHSTLSQRLYSAVTQQKGTHALTPVYRLLHLHYGCRSALWEIKSAPAAK